ncbi:MAG: hypothetical protein WAU81_08715 [Candidatus Aminicenantales bacterium]
MNGFDSRRDRLVTFSFQGEDAEGVGGGGHPVDLESDLFFSGGSGAVDVSGDGQFLEAVLEEEFRPPVDVAIEAVFLINLGRPGGVSNRTVASIEASARSGLMNRLTVS